MSLDRSLKSSSALSRSRSVLTRAERLEVLKDEERWSEGESVFGLPKVRQRHSSAGAKSKGKAETPAEEQAATDGAQKEATEGKS